MTTETAEKIAREIVDGWNDEHSIPMSLVENRDLRNMITEAILSATQEQDEKLAVAIGYASHKQECDLKNPNSGWGFTHCTCGLTEFLSTLSKSEAEGGKA